MKVRIVVTNVESADVKIGEAGVEMDYTIEELTALINMYPDMVKALISRMTGENG